MHESGRHPFEQEAWLGGLRVASATCSESTEKLSRPLKFDIIAEKAQQSCFKSNAPLCDQRGCRSCASRESKQRHRPPRPKGPPCGLNFARDMLHTTLIVLAAAVAAAAAAPDPAVAGRYTLLGEAPIAAAHAMQLPCGHDSFLLMGEISGTPGQGCYRTIAAVRRPPPFNCPASPGSRPRARHRGGGARTCPQ